MTNAFIPQSNPGDARISPIALPSDAETPSPTSHTPTPAPSEPGLYRVTEPVRRFSLTMARKDRLYDLEAAAEKRRQDDQLVFKYIVDVYGLAEVQRWLHEHAKGMGL